MQDHLPRFASLSAFVKVLNTCNVLKDTYPCTANGTQQMYTTTEYNMTIGQTNKTGRLLFGRKGNNYAIEPKYIFFHRLLIKICLFLS